MNTLNQVVNRGLVLVLILFSFSALADDQSEQEKALTLTQETAARFSPDSKIPSRGTVDSVRLVRAKGWEWDHEVRVYLPPSYHLTDIKYPTLWVTDNSLELMQAALLPTPAEFAFSGANNIISGVYS